MRYSRWCNNGILFLAGTAGKAADLHKTLDPRYGMIRSRDFLPGRCVNFLLMDVREFLTSPIAYLPPEKTLEGLSAADAERHIPGAPHSIAEIVAHLAFWQNWFHARCVGQAAPIVSSAAEG